ncbi:hypothetical protein DWU95_44770, partial [Burkholderia contaminans]
MSLSMSLGAAGKPSRSGAGPAQRGLRAARVTRAAAEPPPSPAPSAPPPPSPATRGAHATPPDVASTRDQR